MYVYYIHSHPGSPWCLCFVVVVAWHWFFHSQTAYEGAIEKLTNAFDRVESILSQQRYIAGDRFTLSDVRLFVTLLRFDEVYSVYFKCNTRCVAQSDILLNYVREIYQMSGVQKTVHMDQIKLHYFASHPDLNKYSIVPRGPNFEAMLQKPHNRESFISSINKKHRLSVPSMTYFVEKEESLEGWGSVLVG
jgi:glutathionyl-hydroquinone reductase